MGTPSWSGGSTLGTISSQLALNGAAAVAQGTTELTLIGGMGLVNGTCQATNQFATAIPVYRGGSGFSGFTGFLTWSQQVTPITPEPPARAFASAFYDATALRTLLFGGQNSAGTYLNDTWGLLGNSGVWQQLNTSGGPPMGRAGGATIFDSTNQRMTIFGGSSASGVLSDTWVLAAPAMEEFGCVATSGIPNITRAEGIAERAGDLILNCTGGVPTPSGQPIPQYTLTLSLNTNITSRPVNGGLSEALVFIDEGFPAMQSPPPPLAPVQRSGEPSQILCTPLGSTCAETGTGGTPNPYLTEPNVFVGQQTGASTLQWQIPVDPPGVNHPVRVIRITNVRVNSSQLPPPTGLIPSEITATVTLQNGSQSVPVGGAQEIVAENLAGSAVYLSDTPDLYQCRPHNASLLGASGSPVFDFSVNVEETFAADFKVRNYDTFLIGPQFPQQLIEQNIIGFKYNDESGFYSPSLFTTAPALGLADSGTRILVQFQGVTAGTHLFVPVTIATQGNFGCCGNPGLIEPQGQLRLTQADQNGISSPGYQPVAATATIGTIPVAEVNYSGSTAYAVYEVTDSVPSAQELAVIPVAVAFNSPAPATGAATAEASLAPLSSIMTDDASAPLPRFTKVATAQSAYAINSCAQPALSITSSHVGNFFQGQQNATYTVTVSNPNATATSGTITVSDYTPSGVGVASISGAGWTCSMNACSRSDSLAAGASYPPITVLANVAANAPTPGINAVYVFDAGVTASASDPTTIAAQAGPISFLTGYALNNPALRNNYSGWVGMKVTVGPNPLTVTSLGRICVAGNSGVHTVELVNASTGTVVPGGSADVNMAACAPGQFAYANLQTSITLQPNTAYYLASLELTGGDQWYDVGEVSSTSDASVTNAASSSDNASWAAAPSAADMSYVPANFTYLPGAAAATSFLTGYALNSPALRNNLSAWVGTQFVVGSSPLTVTSLGRLCIAGNSNTHQVQIFSASNGALFQNASGIVSLSGCTPGQFVYAALFSTATLQANATYYIASQEYAGGDQWYDAGQVSSTSAGAVSNPIYSTDGTHWTAPANSAGGSYVPPNFTYLPLAAAVSVTANSVIPSSGSGTSQTFTLQYSDTAGAARLQTVWVYFTATLVNPAANSCLVYYDVVANQINLIQNSGTTWVTATPGAATTLANSQCSLNVAGTSVTMSGNTLTLNLPMTFLPAYAGAKNINMYAADVSGANSGWQQLGTWTVPSNAGVPTAVSATPSSGSIPRLS